MILNYIWVAFFIIAFVVALLKLILLGDVRVFPDLINSTLETAKVGFQISIELTGVLSLWLGLLKIGEQGGIVNMLARGVGPLFSRLFPEIPKNHPVIGTILLNFSANILGLDNAGTPLGMKAMQEMQELNENKEVASNSQIMFIVLNAAGLTLIPITIIAYRVQQGAANPTDIFIPLLITKSFSLLAGLIAVAIYQKINLLSWTILKYLGSYFIFIGLLIALFSMLHQHEIQIISSLASNVILFSVMLFFILIALRKKINVFEAFIDGAKEGFTVAVQIIPYLVAILVAVGLFRACGAMEYFVLGIRYVFELMHINTDFVPALPVAIMKPLSGSGARGVMIDIMKQSGADSFAGRVACVLQGSVETTFYVLAVYFGAVNIKNMRYALNCGLIADLVGFVVAILVSYMFFYVSK
jgi:spore maturation protein SpmA